jgi:glyoxylase-like metal-dependent hydrolase (beta-lactamase superfamily II)
MRMHFLSGGRLRMRKSTFLPDAEKTETIELPVTCALLRHAQGNVLFDTGCHPDIAANAQQRWGDLAKYLTPIMPAGDNVLTSLSQLGLSAGDIDVVVCSHLHTDHCGCNSYFSKATVIAHRLEIEAAKAATNMLGGYVGADWDTGRPIEAIEGERDLFGDGTIVLIHLPGHTPGTLSALVGLERSGQFLLASDSITLRAAFDIEFVPRNTWNGELLLQSFAEVRRIEKAGATVICGHDAAQWERLRKGAEAYD